MSKKKHTIPVNVMNDGLGGGVSIEKIFFESYPNPKMLAAEETGESHRHDRHSFFLLESGSVSIEIDFQKYQIEPHTLIYMHPDQVHRITSFEQVLVSSWAINNESLNPEYLRLLETLVPAKPLTLTRETFDVFSDSISLALRFSERKKDKLHYALLKDSCNVLVALVVAQYLKQNQPSDQTSRYEVITKHFKDMLEHNYTTIKSPAAYAEKLNISTAYLNESVKNATGFSVSHHIRQRVMLEAKRLLYHSEQTVKEVAATLGYDDYPYFSRLFTKSAGMTAVEFRKKNHD